MATGSDMHDAARRIAPVFSGTSLRSGRHLLGMTLAELAAKSGVSDSSLSQAERGQTMLSVKNIVQASKALGVSPEALGSRPDHDVTLAPRLLPAGMRAARERSKAQRSAVEFACGAARMVDILRGFVELPPPFVFE